MTNQAKNKQPSVDDIALPLYGLYQTVKGLDADTGHGTVDNRSYLTLLETLRNGYALLSGTELLSLCEKLWLKPYHRQAGELNRQKLKELIEQILPMSSGMTSQTAPPIPDRDARRMTGKDAASMDHPAADPRETPAAPTITEKEISKRQGDLSLYIDNAADPGGDLAAGTGSSPGTGSGYLIKGLYLPIQARRIEQSVRGYRHRVKGIGKWELDWPATIDDLSKKGYFDHFNFRKGDLFTSNFTVLVDHSDSMAAFGAYADVIAQAVARGNIGQQEKVFYFSNYPGADLYTDRMQSTAAPFLPFAAGARKSILIISDAGAARGSYQEERIKGTIRFLRRLRKHKVAWLNPMPGYRWAGSSAEMIARYVNMFDISESGGDALGNIVRLFRSKITTQKS